MRSVPIEAINFDYIPTAMETGKVLWAQLKFPAPEDMVLGGVVQFSIRGQIIPQRFFVYDVIGTRVVLCCHGQKYPWGFSMNRELSNILGPYRSTNFGTGYPVASMIY